MIKILTGTIPKSPPAPLVSTHIIPLSLVKFKWLNLVFVKPENLEFYR